MRGGQGPMAALRRLRDGALHAIAPLCKTKRVCGVSYNPAGSPMPERVVGLISFSMLSLKLAAGRALRKRSYSFSYELRQS